MDHLRVNFYLKEQKVIISGTGKTLGDQDKEVTAQ